MGFAPAQPAAEQMVGVGEWVLDWEEQARKGSAGFKAGSPPRNPPGDPAQRSGPHPLGKGRLLAVPPALTAEQPCGRRQPQQLSTGGPQRQFQVALLNRSRPAQSPPGEPPPTGPAAVI